MPPAKAFLIDATACCYRAFYAVRTLATSDGRPTNAVYGVTVILQSLLQKEQPAYLAAAFDLPKPTFRHEKFKAYKIQRKPMPDPLIGQLPVIRRLFEAYRIPVFDRAGYEAEDVLATIALRIASQQVEVYLVTGDKDMLQLVNSHIKVYNPHHDYPVADAQAVRARYGVGPDRMVDLMALMGDAIDNIPGVRGIGEKTAVKLLQQFGSLEELYRRLDEVESPAQQRMLKDSQAQAELSRELATIDRHVPIEVSLEALRVHEPDWRALRTLFRELQFKRLLEAVEVHDHSASTLPAVSVQIVATEEDSKRLLTSLRSAPYVALGCWASAADALVLALATEASAAFVLWVDREALRTPSGCALADWLADPAAKKIGHDLKATAKQLRIFDCHLAGMAGDTMLAAYLLNPARTQQSISDVVDEHLHARLAALPNVNGSIGLEHAPFAQAICAVLRLHEVLLAKLRAQQLESLYTELELPLLTVLAHMEADGITVDLPYLQTLRAAMEAQLTTLTQDVYRQAGGEFNLNSPRQLATVLFDQLKLPVIKRAKTGPSTDSDVLRQLSDRHPLPQRLLEYRELAKLKSTYVEALPALVDARTGRLHTSLNQTATATGRLSSSDPNLQNIPIKTELGRQIRKAFIPGYPGWHLVAADYSQIELRLLAHISGDAQLTDAFRRNHDIHRYTASLIYGIAEADVTPQMRSAMKAVNFGIVYGMSAHGLSVELGIPHEDAQRFIEAYFARYPKVRAYFDEQIAKAKEDGYVQTLLGRRRYMPELTSPDPVMRQLGQRLAINAPIQGSAADLIKRAMVQLAAALAQEGFAAKMLLQVHDELVFEAPPEELARLAKLVKETMEGAIVLNVPLLVTIKTGPNWLELTPV